MTRHDIPETIKNYIETAIETRTIDALSLYGLAIKYGDNWRGLIEEVNEYAFSNRHWNGNAHRDVVEAAEAYWITEPIAS